MENICSKPAVIKHSFKCRFVVTADSERCLFVLVMLYKLRSIVTDRGGGGVLGRGVLFFQLWYSCKSQRIIQKRDLLP